MRVDPTALRAPLEKATRIPWPLLLDLVVEDIFSSWLVGDQVGTGRRDGRRVDISL